MKQRLQYWCVWFAHRMGWLSDVDERITRAYLVGYRRRHGSRL